MVKYMRSTKGASKARRDHINAEIRSLRAMLPICADEHERLSYLHSMSIICTFMRKSALLGGVCQNSPDVSLPQQDILHALAGFIVAFTKEGKLLYVSENVSQYLGLSMVDVLQGDTFYHMIDTQDVEHVKDFLKEDHNVSAERSFVCRMVTSKAFRLQYGSCCSVLVRGLFQGGRPDPALFVALCTPTVNRLRDVDYLNDYMCFQTLHKPDMSFTDAPLSVFFHLGFSSEELIGRSWYGLLHPDDLTVSAGLHKTLEDDGDAEVQMVVRLQREDLAWVWIYMRASMEGTRPVIGCKNHVVSETEALYLKEKLHSSASMSSSQGRGHCLKRQSECETQTDEPSTKTRRTSENQHHHTHEEHTSSLFCTPPYSPTSSLSSDFLSEAVDVLVRCEGLDQLRSSQAFPLGALSLGTQLYSDLPRDLHTRVPDAHPVPVDQPVPDACEGQAECVLNPVDLPSFLLPDSALLTPECSPVAERHFQYSETERDEISVLAHQIYSLASSFDAYSAHISRVNTASCWMRAPEPLLDERVMEGILRDLDMVKENHLQSLHVRTPLTVNTHNGCDINSELNQLNHCLYGDIREDVLTEESMY
ncbi:neuronal PAS domain-containing protein 4-like isoform X2 [Triplophysa dalaica]|uniref:neuronal PAS domain-containing protein 4-like isoform X2 n=1 Tax=Triplophysa dalaica TaxID=1582913 RepID=UPI0024DF78BB|nr:neuronal PAS domain-containing protein 4-like isoform X2 [Triplophysa dalaica]